MSLFTKLLSFRKKREGSIGVFLKNELGLKPQNIGLYELALRHSSASKKHGKKHLQNNERLEFLGDAVLGAVIAEYLYTHYPTKNEGFLTSMRSKIVSRSHLNNVAQRLNITPLVLTKMDKRKPAKSLGGDALEALIGAIYLDQGVKPAKAFIHTKILNDLVEMEDLEKTIISYKGLLIEWAQKERKTFAFTLINQWGKQHNMTFEIGLHINEELISKGKGKSKKRAEEEAAKKAFSVLNIPA